MRTLKLSHRYFIYDIEEDEYYLTVSQLANLTFSGKNTITHRLKKLNEYDKLVSFNIDYEDAGNFRVLQRVNRCIPIDVVNKYLTLYVPDKLDFLEGIIKNNQVLYENYPVNVFLSYIDNDTDEVMYPVEAIDFIELESLNRTNCATRNVLKSGDKLLQEFIWIDKQKAQNYLISILLGKEDTPLTFIVDNRYARNPYVCLDGVKRLEILNQFKEGLITIPDPKSNNDYNYEDCKEMVKANHSMSYVIKRLLNFKLKAYVHEPTRALTDTDLIKYYNYVQGNHINEDNS